MSTDEPTVASGVPYLVTSVGDGDEPVDLEQFLGDTVFTIDTQGEPYVVRGSGSRLEKLVRFHEKDEHRGTDVRVWHVSASASGFTAEHIAAY